MDPLPERAVAADGQQLLQPQSELAADPNEASTLLGRCPEPLRQPRSKDPVLLLEVRHLAGEILTRGTGNHGQERMKDP
jgi:hypothetical protein